MTVSHPPGGRLPLLSARPAVTSPAAEHYRPIFEYLNAIDSNILGPWTRSMDSNRISRTLKVANIYNLVPPFGRYQVILLGERGTWV